MPESGWMVRWVSRKAERTLRTAIVSGLGGVSKSTMDGRRRSDVGFGSILLRIGRHFSY